MRNKNKIYKFYYVTGNQLKKSFEFVQTNENWNILKKRMSREKCLIKRKVMLSYKLLYQI